MNTPSIQTCIFLVGISLATTKFCGQAWAISKWGCFGSVQCSIRQPKKGTSFWLCNQLTTFHHRVRARAHIKHLNKNCKTQKSLLMETKSTNISDTCYFKSYCVRCLFDWWPFIHTSPTIGWVFHFMMYILWSELFFFLFLLHVKGDSLTVARNCIPRANKKHAPRNKWQKSLPAFRHR